MKTYTYIVNGSITVETHRTIKDILKCIKKKIIDQDDNNLINWGLVWSVFEDGKN